VSQAEGVLITGVYGSGKSSVAAEIAYLLEQQGEQHGERFALLDLDYLSWAGPDTGDRAAEIKLLSQNLAAILPNYRRIGVTLFVLAYFVRGAAEVHAIRAALDLPLKVVRLAVPLAVIEQRLASDVTSGRRDDLREAAEQIATAEGVGLEDVTLVNDRPVDVVAQQIMTFLGWP
jgi:ABC-type dipeptide/oligopeptide/nickel transport system ATPase component